MLEITVNIKGLDGLVAALKGLAASTPISELQVSEAIQAPPQTYQQPQQGYQAPPVQQMASPPTYQQPQQTAPPVTVPVDQPIQQPVQQPVQAPPAGVPTSDVNYTVEQLAVAATQLVDMGKKDAVVAMLNRFGVPSMMQLTKDQYGAFANELRVLGAKL